MTAFAPRTLAFAVLAAFPALAAYAQVGLTVDASHPGATIDKDVYGQFAEHLGSGIYGGLWVGTDSKIPNVRGWRKDVVGALKDLHVPLVRWPGGCFADEYHWRDGIGPRDKRPVKVNTNWGGVPENNAVGTHEYFDLIEQLGADAYVNGNLGTGSPQETSEWIEYMTSEGKSSLAQLRAKNGHPAPFKVAYFAVGNESWGCGGNMRPQYYTDLYRQYEAFMKAPKQWRPKMIASGGTGEDITWTDTLSRDLKGKTDAISFHYYTLPTGKWDVKGAATGFDEGQWASTMANTMRMEDFITSHVAVLDRNDPEKKIGFFVDEWGTWYDVEKGTNPGFLYQQNTLRDAVLAAVNFNIFHAHADRVRMTNIAQMVNVLQAMILTDQDKMVLTPTYWAYKMYVPFQGAASLPVLLSNNTLYGTAGKTVPGISASAARAKDGKVYVALVNTNPREATDVVLNVAGSNVSSVRGEVLTSEAMDAHNTFQQPQAVKPAAYSASASGGKLTVKVPAKAVMVLAVEG